MDYVTKYSKMVLAGDIVAGNLVKLACKRHLNDLKKSRQKKYPYIFKPELAQLHFDFVNLCHHFKGNMSGKPLELELWQKFVHGSAFGWVRKDNGLRRFTHVYEQVARKNGKSTSAAAVGLYCGFADGENGAEVYSAATKRDQAKIIFETAQQMVKRSPELSELLNVLTNNINMPLTASKFEAVSADARSLDGLNIHCALIDELHAHRTREVYDVLESAVGARLQPLIWVTTTAGVTVNGICKERYDYGVNVLNHVVEDEQLFVYIAQLDPEDDPFNESVWSKPNPNLGVSVNIEDLRHAAQEAKNLRSAYNNFLCKRLNMWVTASESWMDIEKYRQSGKDKVVSLKQAVCYVGVDLSSKLDLSSVILEFPLKDGWYAVIHHSFMPENSVYEAEKRDNVPYSAWIEQGYITAIPGDVIEQSWIEEYILAMSRKYKIVEICYDPWSATNFAQHMEDEGAVCVEIRQGYRTLSEPMKDIEGVIYEGKLIHFDDPVLLWAISNVVATKDPAGNIKPDKSKTKMRIDPAVALITSHTRAYVANNNDVSDNIESENYTI